MLHEGGCFIYSTRSSRCICQNLTFLRLDQNPKSKNQNVPYSCYRNKKGRADHDLDEEVQPASQLHGDKSARDHRQH